MTLWHKLRRSIWTGLGLSLPLTALCLWIGLNRSGAEPVLGLLALLTVGLGLGVLRRAWPLTAPTVAAFLLSLLLGCGLLFFLVMFWFFSALGLHRLF